MNIEISEEITINGHGPFPISSLARRSGIPESRLRDFAHGEKEPNNMDRRALRRVEDK